MPSMKPGFGFATIIAIVALTLGCALVQQASCDQVSFWSNGTWTPPAGASVFKVKAWGAGGGGCVSQGGCVGGGGSGSAVEDHVIDMSIWPAGSVWKIVVGQGGAPGFPVAGNGGTTSVTVTYPGLSCPPFQVYAYGGGGGVCQSTCLGGGGGGSNSSANGPIGGTGNPSGPSGSSPGQGSTVGNAKAGGTGGGSYSDLNGADWNSKWFGGLGWTALTCKAAGGAAGYNGNGGMAYDGGEKRRQSGPYDAPANSGAGGGTSYSCGTGFWEAIAGRGGSGGVTITFDVASPSATPSPSHSPLAVYSSSPSSAPASRSPTPSRTATPSPSPSNSPQPLTQKVSLLCSFNSRHLSAQSDGSVMADRVDVLDWEKWDLNRLANGLYTLKSFHGKYLSVQTNGSVVADRTQVGNWEQLNATISPINRFAFKSYHGTYLTCDIFGKVMAITVGPTDTQRYWTKNNI
ncbi:Fascin-like domain protein [Mollivirus kamchatka]|nr:Fascin-like domain protein [Mollivirus kamchatka]